MNGVWRSLGGLMALGFVGLCAMSGCPGPEPQAAATGGSTGTTSSTSSSSSSTDTTPSGTSTGVQCSCPELDVLFVQDNSASISLDTWSQLVLAVLQADSAITEVLDRACSFHVGVVTSMPEENNPEGCRELGDLARVNNEGDDCEAANGMYLTEEDAADFSSRLRCLLITEQRSDGDEKPMDAVFAALAPAVNAAGGCNEGFLREGAPLLLIIISDIDDTQSDVDDDQEPDTADEWYTRLKQIKGDDDDLLAAIGILGPTEAPGGGCPYGDVVQLHAFLLEFLPSQQAALPICDISDDALIDATESLGGKLCPP